MSVDANIEVARGRSASNPVAAPFWFRRYVPNGAPWDYKQQGKQYEAFGNFNFGATGRQIGFPTLILEQEAGRAQQRDHNWRPEFGRPGPHLAPFLGTGSFGDDPVDQFWIGEGARYFDEP